MKKRFTVSAIAAFLSVSMLTGCNADNNNRDLSNQNAADRDDRVNIDPVRFNANDQNTRVIRREYQFGMLENQDGRFIQHPNTNFNQQAQPRAFYNRQIPPDQNLPAPNQGDMYQNNQANNRANIEKPNNQANNKTNEAQPNAQAASDFQSKVIQLTNQERKKQGLPGLQSDSQLLKVAQTKSDDMAKNNYFSHTSPTYGSPFQMLKTFGVSYSTAAENIAAGQKTPEQVVNSWMNSAGHRQNILNKNVTHIGVGYSKDETKGSYWTQIFIGK